MTRRDTLMAAGAVLLAAPALAQSRTRLRFAVTDVDGAENLQREFGPFKAAFERVVPNIELALFPVSGRTSAVEAMSANQVELVLTGPAEYVVFHARLRVQPVVVWQRPDYFSQIVVLAEGPIKRLADLRGRRISFGDIGSTSQHLGPAQILLDQGQLAYNRDYQAIFLRRNVAVEAMRRGDIAAIGMNLTHLHQIRRAIPDVKLSVIARGPDLPDDLIIAAPTVPPAMVETVRRAFVDHAEPLMQAVLQVEANARWAGGTFLPNVSDRDYDVIRAMYRTIGINEFTRFIGQG